MTWNHRVVRIRDGKGEPLLGIYEVYYDDDGKPEHRTLEPIGVITEDVGDETKKDMRKILGRMLNCLDQPILDDEEHFKED